MSHFFDVAALAKKIAAQHCVDFAELMSRSRRRPVVRARHELMWKLRQAGLSYPRIARALAVDHTGVIYGVHKHESLFAKPVEPQQQKQEQDSAEANATPPGAQAA